MKRISALAAVILVLCLQLSVYADELTPENPSGGFTVTFDATPKYVVHIPASTVYDPVNGNDLPVTADVSYLPGDTRLVVRITGLDAGGLTMTAGENSFSIPVTLGGGACASGSVVARYDTRGNMDSSIGMLRLEPGAKAPAGGQYSGSPTFTVSVE